MNKYEMPFTVVVGYFHMPYMAVSFPHVWIETSGGAVTDITFSDPNRMISVLGQGFGFQEGAVKPEYTRTPTFNVFPKAMRRDQLEQHARNLEGYMKGGGEEMDWMRKMIHDTVTIATDGTDRVDIKVDPSMLAPGVGGRAAASGPTQNASKRP
jgi:hypothetical protein